MRPLVQQRGPELLLRLQLGMCSSSTSSVIAIAKTPSLNVSIREVSVRSDWVATVIQSDTASISRSTG